MKNWTPQQRIAIETAGRDVLVAASAGTGKTAVLTERVVRSIADGGLDVLRTVVLTFTEASAEEMRSRITARLRGLYQERRDPRLGSQLLKLDLAAICTIDAFCKRVCDRNFPRLGMDPVYAILTDDERRLLKSEVLGRTVDEAWQEPGLADGLAGLLRYRRVKAKGEDFLWNVIRISDFLESVVDPAQWLQLARGMMAVPLDAPHMHNARRQFLLAKLHVCRGQLEYAATLEARMLDGVYLGGQIREMLLPTVDVLLGLLDQDRLADCVLEIGRMDLPRLRSRPRDLTEEEAGLIKSPVKKAMDTLKGLTDLSIFSADYATQIAPLVADHGRTLVELVSRFRDNYAQAKLRMRCMDFADLEHGVLRLLNDYPEVALGLRDAYDAILVDEYQDVNGVQRAILKRIHRGENLFAVGDVKQCIYAFRQSRPEIFLGQLRDVGDHAGSATTPIRVDLQENFRSRKEVLAFANRLFSRIMREQVVGIAYDRKAELTCGAEYEPLVGARGAVELVILDQRDVDSPEDDDQTGREEGHAHLASALQRQAATIAHRIREMVGADTGRPQFQVFDKPTGRYRGVTWGDIVILMRSLAGRAPQYVEILRLAGIPVSSQSGAGFFAATEIVDIVALLKVLDNPLRDIELAAVLRSPLFGLAEDAMAAIRLNGRSGVRRTCYHECLIRYTRSGPDAALRDRLAAVCVQLDQWRDMARQGQIARLLWHVYRDTGYLSFMTALPNGRQRRANLLKLHDRAIQFEGMTSMTRGLSLGRFVEFLEDLLEQGQDWAPAEPDGSAEDAVRIQSIHKAKGLEFPVVFLVDLDRAFNRSHLRAEVSFNEEDTLGIKVVHPGARAKVRSAAYEIIREKHRTSDLAEEMRILYVAVTRARERLVLCGNAEADHCRAILRRCAIDHGEPAPAWELLEARSPMDWLLWGLGDQGPLQEAFGLATEAVDEPLFRAEVMGSDPLRSIADLVQALKQSRCSPRVLSQSVPHDQGAGVRAIEQSMTWQYPHATATRIQAKQSVSDLSHKDDVFAQLDLGRALSIRPCAAGTGSAGTRTRVEPMELGTGMHLVLQTLDLSDVTAEAIRGHAGRLAQAGLIRTQVLDQMSYQAMAGFFTSDVGRLCLAGDSRVYREWPFTIRIPALSCNGQCPAGAIAEGETVVVQGVVDLVILTPDGAQIVDFKSDTVSAGQVPGRAMLYQGQMQLYAKAVQSILNCPMSGTWLYFLVPGQAFLCPMGISHQE